MGILHINNTEEFDNLINSSDKPVLVDFWADWCGPCKMLLPIIDEVYKTCGDIAQIAKVNVDEVSELASRYGVMTIPTLILFKKGEIATKSVGVIPQTEIEKMIKNNI